MSAAVPTGTPLPVPGVPTAAPPPLPEGGLRVVALGGIGEIGRNMTVFQYVDRLLVVDCGVLFPEDDAPGKPGVVVLTHQYWERRFASDPRVINRVIYVNRRPATVIGVMRASFQGLDPTRAIDVFAPISTVAETGPSYYDLNAPDVWWVQVFARIRPGVSDGAGAAGPRPAGPMRASMRR